MLRGYWCIILAIAGLALAANAQPIGNSARSDAPAAQSNESAPKDSDIAVSLSRISSALEAQNAKADPYEEDRNKREIRDLQAQENSAHWAKWMFYATAVAVILSVIGVILIYITFRATRHAANAAAAQVKLMRESQRADCYFSKLYLYGLGDDGVSANQITDYLPNVCAVFIIPYNQGGSTGYIEDISYGYQVSPDAPAKVSYEKSAVNILGQPMLIGHPGPNSLCRVELTDDEINRIEAGQHLFVWIRGRFRDQGLDIQHVGIGAVWCGPVAFGGGFSMRGLGDIAPNFLGMLPNRPDLNFRYYETKKAEPEKRD